MLFVQAIWEPLRGVGMNGKPVKKPKQRAMALKYKTFFASSGTYRRIPRFQQRFHGQRAVGRGQKLESGHGAHSSFTAPLPTEIKHCLT